MANELRVQFVKVSVQGIGVLVGLKMGELVPVKGLLT